MKITETHYAEYSDTIETTVKGWSETNRDPTFAVGFNARVANDLLTIDDIEMSVGDLGKFITFLQEVEKAELGRTAGKRVILTFDGSYVVKAPVDDEYEIQLTHERKCASTFEMNGPEFTKLTNRANGMGVKLGVVDV
jgi:hypothetical protein